MLKKLMNYWTLNLKLPNRVKNFGNIVENINPKLLVLIIELTKSDKYNTYFVNGKGDSDDLNFQVGRVDTYPERKH
jgi:hypothetical protein